MESATSKGFGIAKAFKIVSERPGNVKKCELL